jgi:hypothetical protein
MYFFNKPYNKKEFQQFLENKFLPEDFRIEKEEIPLPPGANRIKKIEKLGKAPSLNNLQIYEIHHHSENDPRVSLTRESFSLLKHYQKKNALAVYVSEKSDNYRFSLITSGFELTEKGKAKRKFSNPRRFSFYLGPDAKVKTPTKYLKEDGRVTDFEDLQERFNIQVLTKQFYKELSSWYFWALQHVEFPKDAEKQNGGKNIAVIRLITRLVFIWFMKKKGLVPNHLFDPESINKILADLTDEKSTYYKAILQNLFFATLNTKIKDRRFRSKIRGHKGYNPDFMTHNIYRYQKLFKKPEKMKEIFNGIPFLNGGLFECLDKREKENGENEYIRIDGFTNIKKHQPKVPNFLFFSDEQKADLNEFYESGHESETVRGLIKILNDYNFTIDENTPIDQEVSLDPELLGQIFENLLASYNPETATTARKATGSYYTPRPIVEYMVDESLKQYFLEKLKDTEKSEQKLQEKMDNLLSYYQEGHEFSDVQVNTLIDAINNDLKIIDPAVGSGAFPMGILQKLVLVLSKLDPHNEKWKEHQVKAVNENVTDPDLKRKLLQKIEENFETNQLDYGRKLYLIQKCIYGVDIQPVAIQIAKLRFFISLLVDENIEEGKENKGVEPLPNLETKFVSANSLISLENNAQKMLKAPKVAELEKKSRKIRADYFSASLPKEKRKLREQDKKIREELLKELKKSGFADKSLEQMASWDPYDTNTASDFFNPEWMFGIEGFDVVIGNPPYVDSEEMTKNQRELRDKYRDTFISAKGNWDLFIVFIELGLSLCNEYGTCSFIVKNTLVAAAYSKKIKEIIRDDYSLLSLRDYSGVDVFREQDVYPVVFVIKNAKTSSPVKFTLMFNEREVEQKNLVSREVFSQDIFWDRYFFPQGIVNLIVKVSYKSKLKEHKEVQVDSAATVSEAYEIKKLLKEYKDKNFSYKKFINTGTIDRFISLWGVKATQYIKERYERPIIPDKKLLKLQQRRIEQTQSPKIIVAGMSKIVECYLDLEAEYLAGKSTTIIRTPNVVNLKVLCAILNSKLLSFWYRVSFNSLSMSGGYLNINRVDEVPIPRSSEINKETKKKLACLVDKILQQKKQNPNADTKDLETQIDQLVYKLYDLTEEEIEIVEKNVKQ